MSVGHVLAYFVKLNKEAVVIGLIVVSVLCLAGHLSVGAELFVAVADCLAGDFEG